MNTYLFIVFVVGVGASVFAYFKHREPRYVVVSLVGSIIFLGLGLMINGSASVVGNYSLGEFLIILSILAFSNFLGSALGSILEKFKA